MMKAILFDAGGTLIHMDRRFVIQKLNENGVPATLEDFARAHVVAMTAVTHKLRSDDPGDDLARWLVYAATLMRELECDGEALDHVRAALMSQHAAGDLWTYVLDGTFETLDSLRTAGYRMAIISNADGRVEGFLKKAGLTDYFEFVLDSGVFGIEKPDVRIFQHALERLGVAPADAVYIGDVYEVDVVGARAAGMQAVLLNAGEADARWDCPVIASLSDLPGVLQGELPASARA